MTSFRKLNAEASSNDSPFSVAPMIARHQEERLRGYFHCMQASYKNADYRSEVITFAFFSGTGREPRGQLAQ